MNNKDGGPAFPLGRYHDELPNHPGMSLRDYFAAAAMQGILSNPGKDTGSIGKGNEENNERLSDVAYMIADAMLEAREK